MSFYIQIRRPNLERLSEVPVKRLRKVRKIAILANAFLNLQHVEMSWTERTSHPCHQETDPTPVVVVSCRIEALISSIKSALDIAPARIAVERRVVQVTNAHQKIQWTQYPSMFGFP